MAFSGRRRGPASSSRPTTSRFLFCVPQQPRWRAWSYQRYDRLMGFTTHAQQSGLLANAVFNRDILPGRVEEYAAAMEAGNWRDLLSDPITITDDGQVINGQHRLAAASGVDWDEVENDPA